jgi:tRNA pseudouridine38-40 synthase
MRYALLVYYDGRRFAGSQRQPKERTVEGELIAALEALKIDYSGFKSAGRTDKGVCALGNVFAITTYSKLIKSRVINAALSKDVRVLAVRKVKEDFNPRHAQERVYTYFLFDEGYDLTKMKDTAKTFKGRKSFHNFSTTDYRNPIRKIDNVNIQREKDVILIMVSGESFLWQMVRRIVTALKMAGRGELTAGELKKYFDPDYKKKIPPSAAKNLVLWEVKYDFEFKDEGYSKEKLIKELEESWKNTKTEAVILEGVLRKMK